ncbi:hypothetical protein PR202_ga02356 [Eleusine coracana subsp. coracana]|uniref:Secreted protein n=1 Tax=Eleusine coracana subsp. coracana TaxID=191504 RepID=A0AAV5BKN5_ELECO|nr:hypothetical protein PR202_ga02356 [Eleusine coracana subsp. coracana]
MDLTRTLGTWVFSCSLACLIVACFNLPQVEEECGLTTVDDIAAAVHHVMCIIDANAVTQQLLGVGAMGH